jgi:hypothetical protein
MGFMIPKEMMDWSMWAKAITRQSSPLKASDNGGIWLENTIMQSAKNCSSAQMVGEAMGVETEAGNSFCRIWRMKLE